MHRTPGLVLEYLGGSSQLPPLELLGEMGKGLVVSMGEAMAAQLMAFLGQLNQRTKNRWVLKKHRGNK